jgi:cytidyltransferase-like protein
MKQFKKVAVGGTFDELHKGHKALLRKAFEIGEKILIGLSSDDFASKMNKPHITATYEERLRELQAFLEELKAIHRVEVVPLNDSFGQTISDEGIDALVVSQDTEKTAEMINQKRVQAGILPLKIITINMIPAENETPISTTRIRGGEIDHNGRLLKKQRNYY